MTLIDKDALVAEIEKFEKALKNACKPNPFGNVEECMTDAELQVLDVVKEIINYLEVKKMDIEKEFRSFLDDTEGMPRMWHSDEQLEWGLDIAEHFFELGLSASNPTTAKDRGTAEEIIINLKRVENDYRIDLTKEIEWVMNKVKK